MRHSGGKEHASALLAIRLLTLTGMRKGESVPLRWDEVDLRDSLLLLADSKMGRKAIPVGATVLKFLCEEPGTKGNPHVCYGARLGPPFLGLQKFWERARSRAGLGDVRLHYLQHSYARVGAAAGFGLFLIRKVLGHSQASTTQPYPLLAEDSIRHASERISGEFEAFQAYDSLA